MPQTSSSSEPPRFRVAIWFVTPPYPLAALKPCTSGGGIGGLILATTIGNIIPPSPLISMKHTILIPTVGAGIAIWRRTNEVMSELGLLDDMKAAFTKPPESSHGIHYRRSDIPEGGYDWFQHILRCKFLLRTL
ncbi:hypothetical protein BU15DRAFT_83736 [Melanogaster broomeanus]|nr:hypothetical protein BU15DRAFT_83736 [Melanogaster broomeanus]